jgi:hypothetical protein
VRLYFKKDRPWEGSSTETCSITIHILVRPVYAPNLVHRRRHVSCEHRPCGQSPTESLGHTPTTTRHRGRDLRRNNDGLALPKAKLMEILEPNMQDQPWWLHPGSRTLA